MAANRPAMLVHMPRRDRLFGKSGSPMKPYETMCVLVTGPAPKPFPVQTRFAPAGVCRRCTIIPVEPAYGANHEKLLANDRWHHPLCPPCRGDPVDLCLPAGAG